MTEEQLRLEIIVAILELESAMSRYALFTQDNGFIDRWSISRNEYLSLLTWMRN